MPSTTIFALVTVLAAPAIVGATTISYFRSVFCDAQSSQFHIETYTSPRLMDDDKGCHRTPAGTMGVQLAGSLESECVILAYEDFGCSNLIGSIPTSGKCVASNTARIGSWRANCNATATLTDNSDSNTLISTPNELKRRNRTRFPVIRAEPNMTSICTTITKTVPSIENETLSTSVTIATAQLNLTSSITNSSSVQSMTSMPAVIGAENATNGNLSYTAPRVITTATYVGNSDGNGTVALRIGNAATRNFQISTLVLGALVTVLGATFCSVRASI